MRFIHISDLHLGKKLNETDMSPDIEHALFEEIFGRIYSLISEEKKPDALIIAGDIFERSLPPAEAENMFGRLLTRAVELGLKVYIISGNHDSALRLASNNELFSRLGIFVTEPFSAETPLRVEKIGGFDLVMLPFITLSEVKAAYPDEEIKDITAAIKTVLKNAGYPNERPCLLAAHQTIGMTGFNEVGNAENADISVLDGFAYCFLGHIHTARPIGKNAAYCGSPVCCSGTEAKNPQKYCHIVDIENDGSFELHRIEIKPLHEFKIIEGSFNLLMSDETPSSDAYCYITLSDFEQEDAVAARLLTKFPNYMAISFKSQKQSDIETDEAENEDFDFHSSFSNFYKLVTGEDISEELLTQAISIFEDTEKDFNNGKIQEN